ncbi:MFS-type transporter clz9-like [Harmonia axyridis]|uniref:MFS-type transporter clz9-like n=1 Tax=Harmonia axyridis TaxID=115357 RepID=UPI001E276E89|nr:MFS-type transporter clz9-like [Harmonia axyridis]
MAGNDWFTNFMKRNPKLAIRSPEATSLSRATSFNRTNVQNFFEKYRSVLERYSFPPSRIWNVDETGITTVQKPKKIVAGKGTKQVGAVTSAERGVLVTLVVATNAIGNAIPCMFVFPRIRYNDIFVRNGPPECIGVGNQSGWMTQKEFVKFIDHFIHHVKPSKEDPVLLLLDNHSSHVNVEVVNKAKENNIILLSFPPHCSHRLQPLDVGVYGPLKNYLNRAQTSWMSSNPGKTMTIYDLPGIVKDALPLALNPRNVINAFRKSGVWPLNDEVFQDSDFAPSYVTDRPDPTNQDFSSNSINSELLNDMPDLDSSTVVTAHVFNGPVAGPSGLQRDSNDFSIETVRPLPKASPRAPSNRKRAKKSAILTDTPEKKRVGRRTTR